MVPHPLQVPATLVGDGLRSGERLAVVDPVDFQGPAG